MEENPLNPAPQPTPEPQQPETPALDTSEPAPQDNFAEPAQETGTSWQPTQATAPQLGGMDVPPAMTQPAPAPKKSNAGVIIGIIAGALVVVGAIVAIILLANGSNSSGSGGTGPVLSEQAKLRNKQREDDLERYLQAADDYTNNNGKTPFGTVYDASKMGSFVFRYIDSGIDKEGAAEGKSFVCSKNSGYSYGCPQFTDIQGKILGWTVDVAESGKKNEKIKYTSDDGVDAIIHVYVKATCGSNDGTYTSSDSEKTYAMFYVLEGGKILCGDSENGLANKEKEEPKNDNTSIEKRNTEREDNVARLITSVNDYQTNNNGKTPFGKAYNQSTLGQFVYRYIDSGIDNTGAASGQSFLCKKNKCDEFSDPDGKINGFTVDVAKSGANDEPIKYKAEDGVDHIFHVYVNAGCGSKDGTYDTGTGERQVAIFYIGENNVIICNDNH